MYCNCDPHFSKVFCFLLIGFIGITIEVRSFINNQTALYFEISFSFIIRLSIWINTILKSLHLKISLLPLIRLRNFCGQNFSRFDHAAWFLDLANIYFHGWAKFRNSQDINFSGCPNFKSFLAVPLFKKLNLKMKESNLGLPWKEMSLDKFRQVLW